MGDRCNARYVKQSLVGSFRDRSNRQGVYMSKQEWQHIQVSDQDGVQIVTFRDRKLREVREIDQLGLELCGLAAPGNKLVLDCTGVEYLSIDALGKLIRLRRKIDEAGGKLALCGLAPQTLDIFKRAKLDEYFSIWDDRKAAIQQVL